MKTSSFKPSYSAYKVKGNAHYICQQCSSTEFIQAHHQIPKDDTSQIVLCGECHCEKHPNVPKALFFSKTGQPYWHNKSASSIARETGVHPRTIIRRARRLKLPAGILSAESESLLKLGLGHRNKIGRVNDRGMAKLRMRIPKSPPYRSYVPDELGNEGFIGDVEILSDAFTATMMKPGVSLRKIRESLLLVIRDLDLRIEDVRLPATQKGDLRD